MGESLGGFDHMQTLVTHHCLYVCKSKEREKKAGISVGLKLSGVLHEWMDQWTRPQANVLMPRTP